LSISGRTYHPELGTLVDWQAYKLSDDPDTQVAQTIHRMRRNVIEDSTSAPILNTAAQIQASGPTGDPVTDTFLHIKNRVGFRQDEQLGAPMRGELDGDVVEVLIRPRDLAQMDTPLEDCDGFASYGPAVLRALGVPCSFVTVAADNREPGRFSHVYAACYPDGQRVALDSSHGPYPGWDSIDTGQVTRVKEWPIDGPDWGQLLLIGVILFATAWVWRIF
jgi:hypothetical protein